MHSIFYRPQMKFGQGNVFTGVYLSGGRGVVITGYMTRGGVVLPSGGSASRGSASRRCASKEGLPSGEGAHLGSVCLQGVSASRGVGQTPSGVPRGVGLHPGEGLGKPPPEIHGMLSCYYVFSLYYLIITIHTHFTVKFHRFQYTVLRQQ